MRTKNTLDFNTLFYEKEILEDLDFFEKLLWINSQSKNHDGVNKAQTLLESKLKELGMQVDLLDNPSLESGKLLCAKINSQADFTINFIGHVDTVLPLSEDNQPRLSECRTKMYGAGVADNKSGIFIAYRGIKLFLDRAKDSSLHFNFVSSPSEELGSTGFHHFFKEMGFAADLSLGFEPSMPDGSLIHSRNGNRWYRLTVEGRTFHAGRAQKGHMNSAHDLCRMIADLSEKAMQRDDITFNIGQLSGGHSYNTICERASAKIDTRFSNFEGVDFIEKLFDEKELFNHKRKCAQSDKTSKLSIQLDDDCPPMPKNENSDFFLGMYKNAIQKIESKSVGSIHCGGAADVNHFCHPKSICFDGLGAIGGFMHRKDEYIEVSSLKTRSEALCEFLISLDKFVKNSK